MPFKSLDEINKQYNVGSGFMTLVEGDNKVRIVSGFADYGNHFNPTTKQSVICIGKENCGLCKKGDKPSIRFLTFVIDRSDKKIKPFNLGYQIYKQIVALKNNPDYEFEDVPDYDITIHKTGTGKASEYTVIGARKSTALTEDEMNEIIDRVKDPVEMVANMKAKVGGVVEEKETETVIDDEEIDVKDVPF